MRLKQRQLFPRVQMFYGFFHSAVWLQPYSPAYAELGVVEITIL